MWVNIVTVFAGSLLVVLMNWWLSARYFTMLERHRPKIDTMSRARAALLAFGTPVLFVIFSVGIPLFAVSWIADHLLGPGGPNALRFLFIFSWAAPTAVVVYWNRIRFGPPKNCG